MTAAFLVADLAAIGYGSYQIAQGNYISGGVEVGLGFMGVGIYAGSARFLKYVASPVNKLIRLRYVTWLKSLENEVKVLRKAGKSSKEIAHWAVETRNALKVSARARMIEEGGVFGKVLVKILEKWNMHRYQDPVGPTVEWFIKEGKTFDEMIESAGHSNELINRLFSIAI